MVSRGVKNLVKRGAFFFFFFISRGGGRSRCCTSVLAAGSALVLEIFSVIIVSEIVHFYSFKNGVGRDMAVFNEGETIFCGRTGDAFFLRRILFLMSLQKRRAEFG